MPASAGYATDSKQPTLTIDPAPVVAPTPAPSLPVVPKAKAELGHDFSHFVASDSTVPVTYSVTGALPKALSLNASSGLNSGKPTGPAPSPPR